MQNLTNRQPSGQPEPLQIWVRQVAPSLSEVEGSPPDLVLVFLNLLPGAEASRLEYVVESPPGYAAAACGDLWSGAQIGAASDADWRDFKAKAKLPSVSGAADGISVRSSFIDGGKGESLSVSADVYATSQRMIRLAFKKATNAPGRTASWERTHARDAAQGVLGFEM